MTVSLNSDKHTNIIKLCKSMLGTENTTIRSVEKLNGTMISYLPGVEFGKMHYRQLEHCKIEALKYAKGNFNSNMILSKQAIEDIHWWIHNVKNPKQVTLSNLHQQSSYQQIAVAPCGVQLETLIKQVAVGTK